MFPPIFPLIKASPACVAFLKSGTGEIRFYQFGRAPQNVQKPYAVWQRVFGNAFEYLGDSPDADSFTVQVDIYSDSADVSRSVALAVRDAIQYPHSENMQWLGEIVDSETKNYRFAMQSDWIVERA